MARKAMTVRIEEEEYKKIIKFLVDRDESFNDFVLNLIRNEMAAEEKRKIELHSKEKNDSNQMTIEDYLK